MNSLPDLMQKSDVMSARARNGVRPVGYDTWHLGEIALQRSAGAADALSNHARRVLLPFLTDQLRAFFPLLPFIVVSFVDAKGNPWGTILPGVPGFVSSPTPDILHIGRAPPAGDPFAAALREGASIGLLGIELPTRRRNRVNGIVSTCDGSSFTVTVQQAYGNCPRYIQQRDYADAGELPQNVNGEIFASLDDIEARALLHRTDTMFVASYAPGPDGTPAMDVSHRGGKPGFLRLDDDSGVTIPDFAGNRYFNTLGNILCTGRAGLVVPDFETGDVLLLTGGAAVGVDEGSYAEAAQAGAERLWRMFPRQGRWLRGALPIAFQLRSWSPHTLATGEWLQS
jgi:predicted pyridoxine 5'-phosphate oxidase superfamily flavin-nucleotide-binding protein